MKLVIHLHLPAIPFLPPPPSSSRLKETLVFKLPDPKCLKGKRLGLLKEPKQGYIGQPVIFHLRVIASYRLHVLSIYIVLCVCVSMRVVVVIEAVVVLRCGFNSGDCDDGDERRISLRK